MYYMYVCTYRELKLCNNTTQLHAMLGLYAAAGRIGCLRLSVLTI